MIFATAVEHGLNLVTGDGAMRRHDVARRVVVW
jgi:PIN domain nuclease of toxin-antitoxin system